MIIYVFPSEDMVFEDEPHNFQGKIKSSVNIYDYMTISITSISHIYVHNIS